MTRVTGLAWLGLVLACGGGGPGNGGLEPLEFERPEPWGDENPRFTPRGGVFSDPFVLTLEAQGGNAAIRYTLDGSIPGPGSDVYTEPLQISESTRVRASVEKDGLLTVPVTHHYLRADDETMGFTSELPLLVLDTHGAPAPDPDDYEWTAGSLAVFDVEPGGSRPRLDADLDLRVGFKVRGSSTRHQDKSSWSLEVWDYIDGEDRDQAVLGMPPGSDWVLFAPYSFDRALIRNALIYDLSNQIGRYAPRTRLVEVMIASDGADLDLGAYNGVYILMERIKRGADRVNVAKLPPTATELPTISGGYILKVDRNAHDEMGFDAGGSDQWDQGLNFVYPQEINVLPEQQSYVVSYIDEFAAAIGAADYVHPQTGLAYDDYIDVDTFIDHHILNVLAKNPDALRLSAYMYKDRDGPLAAGPIWDFDRSMGSEDPRDDDPQQWDPTGDGTPMFEFGWWGRLFENPEFLTRYKARWEVLVEDQLSEENVRATIDALVVDLASPAQRNYDRWPENAPTGTHAEEVEALKTWLDARIAWIRGNVDGL